MSTRSRRTFFAGSGVAVVLAIVSFASHAANAPVRGERAGPGMQGPGVLDLDLKARSSDLAHVDPGVFAAALQGDVGRIFEFVRDRVAYESYPGLLRGARGTLLAMAGNSVDRASLLAAMLRSSGRRVRFAAGRRSDEDARTLAASLWTKRPSGIPEAPDRTLDPGLAKFAENLRARVETEYRLIQETLAQAGMKAPPAAPESPGRDEGPLHYWVQLEETGQWIDLDPSFSNSTPGQTHAKVEQTCDELPAALTTRIEITLRLEEYTGDQVAVRDLLKHSTTMAEISGDGLFLTHVPENWKEPSASVSDALAEVIVSTGRITPVLVARDAFITGEPFRQRPPATTGLAGVRNMLGGATRKDAPLATAEFLEIEITSPDGRTEKVIRELFDVVGKGRRAGGKALTSEEAKAAVERSQDQTAACYDLFFTSGRIDPAHLAGVGSASDGRAKEEPRTGARPAAEEPIDVSTLLRQVNLALVMIADGLLSRVDDGAGGCVVFYPDSPRIQVVDLRRSEEMERFTIDLRRTRLIGRPNSKAASLAFDAQILRGVFEGALERSLGEFLGGGREAPGTRSFSTSELVELARAEGRPIHLIRAQDVERLEGVPPDGLARLKESLAGDRAAIGPNAPVTLGKSPRFAWWSLDPSSGETVAMTDEGLHMDGTEHTIVRVQTDGPRGMWVCVWTTYVRNVAGGVEIVRDGIFLAMGEGHLFDVMRHMGINNWSTMLPR